MKKMFLALAIVSAIAALPGCAAATAWFDQFQTNPLASVQLAEQTAQVAISDATIAFSVVKNFLPVADQAKAQTDFNEAVVTANHALQVLNDAVTAAADAKESNPDFTGAIAAVEAAVTQIVAIVEQYKAVAPAPASVSALGPRPESVPGLAQAEDSVKSLHRFSAKK
jgi:hypothetical protein